MATAYTASGVAAGIQPRTSIPGLICEVVTYALTANPVVNDTIDMFVLPANSRLIDVILDVDALDTTNSVVLAAGTSATPTLFISGATIGRTSAGGIQHATQAGTTNYTSTTDQHIVVKFTTAPTGPNSTNSLRLAVIYSMSANSNS